MITRPTPPAEKKDQGFTLIELLVVVLIIGILAAIAIPVFLSQREKAADSATKSDLKNAATLMETWFVDTQDYGPTTGYATNQFVTLQKSTGVTVTLVSADTAEYCLKGVNTGGSKDFYYDSGAGGLSETICT